MAVGRDREVHRDASGVKVRWWKMRECPADDVVYFLCKAWMSNRHLRLTVSKTQFLPHVQTHSYLGLSQTS